MAQDCHYWLFNHGLRFKDSVCNGCHDSKIFYLNISNIAIITVENVVYCCITHDLRKSKAICLIDNSMFEDRGYI